MDTEAISSRYRGLDDWSDAEILDAFWEGQARAVAAVRPALPALADAARAIVERLGKGGRILYAGAGSAGRQAALDGMELGATFGWPASRIAFLLAEGTTFAPGVASADEDDIDAARAQAAELALHAEDVMIAVAASGTTPFTLTCADAARAAGALVVAIANNPGTPLLARADHAVLLQTGAEVISGSTRMNAGTAQKAALGFLSSLVMTRLGHVHDGLMVSMRTDCAKLSERAARIVAEVAGCPPRTAAEALAASAGRIKPAVLMARGVPQAEAERMLAESGNNLRLALSRLSRSE